MTTQEGYKIMCDMGNLERKRARWVAREASALVGAAVAAAHAFAAEPQLFDGIRLKGSPPSWTEMVANPDPKDDSFAVGIWGALEEYDWTDLVPFARADSPCSTGNETGGAAIDRDFLVGLLRIPSVTPDTARVNEAVEYVRDYLERAGVFCAEEMGEDGARRVLYASTRREKTPDYLLLTHLDVVPGSPDQFKPRIEGDRIYARGAHDCKGNVAIAAQILRNLNGSASVGVVFAADEETGGLTTSAMAKRGYVPRKLVLVLDAGTYGVFYAQKGSFNVCVQAVGRGGHSACPWSCVNPIVKLTEGYRAFSAEWPMAPKDGWGDVVSPTVISGGDAKNRIPDRAEMWLNLRFVNPDAPDRLVRLLKERGGFEIAETRLVGKPMVSDREHPEIRRLLAMRAKCWPGKRARLERMMAMTDACHYADCGVPVAIVGSLGENAHADGEWGDMKNMDENLGMLSSFLVGEERAEGVKHEDASADAFRMR